MINKKQFNIFSIRKFKAGVASVLIASAFLLFSGASSTAFAQMDMSPSNSSTEMTMGENQPTSAKTTPEEVKMAVDNNIKAETSVPAAYLEKANEDGTGPFLAGVNSTIPFEAFGGDGMLTRLLLADSKDAPWSDNGKNANAAIKPLKNLTDMEYFYKVSLDGDATDKNGKALIESLKNTGTHTYNATVNVFGKMMGNNVADENNIVATRAIKITINGLTPASDIVKAVEENIKKETEVPTTYIENANADGTGPFLAGVNNTIPFEAFGGDGMLTRLLLMAANGAPWSDNGVDMNSAILPLDTLTNGQYFYKVSLDGVAWGKTGKELIDALKAAGMSSYNATVNVYGNKNGMADETKIIASKKVLVKVNMMMEKEMPMPENKMNMADDMSMQGENKMNMADDMSMQGENKMNMPDKTKKKLSKTGATTSNSLGIISLMLSLLAGFGLRKKF